jgi:hypothetical protein
MKSDNGDVRIILFPWGMHFELYHLEIYLTSYCYGFFKNYLLL